MPPGSPKEKYSKNLVLVIHCRFDTYFDFGDYH